MFATGLKEIEVFIEKVGWDLINEVVKSKIKEIEIVR